MILFEVQDGKRRSRFDIIIDILNVSVDGVNKTKIVYEANLNFKQAKEYIDFLIEAELMEEKTHRNAKIYQTTERGKELLKNFKKIIEEANL
jgi:predicted transcriptional regulator